MENKMSNIVEEDVWTQSGQSLSEVDVNPPVRLLRNQADALGRLTDNKVLGIIQTESLDGRTVHHFWIRAPKVGDYWYEVMVAVHDLNMYPVMVYSFIDNSGQNIRSRLDQNELSWSRLPHHSCEDENVLKEEIKRILTHRTTVETIRLLRAQSE
jgi:hypothetical protein